MIENCFGEFCFNQLREEDPMKLYDTEEDIKRKV